MHHTSAQYLVALVAGAGTGVLGALLGTGGGVFLIPILVLGLAVPMHHAVATSILSVVATSSAVASTNVERGLMLFLAVLVEVGAALGIYFATGHIRSEPRGYRRPQQGAVIIEGNVVEFGRRDQTAPAPLLQQIAGPGGRQKPRRVPRLTQN